MDDNIKKISVYRYSKIFTMIGILLAIAFFFYYIWNTNTLLAEVHNSVKQTGMIASSAGFILNKKDIVKISVKSSIDDGDALITLQNENHEILYTFNTNCLQKESFSLESGTYNIRIDGDKFKGKFDIVVRK
ncbi:MAG TPA: hypothetical protein GXX75_07130 [Clostridiales bacterium]|nr:hypothetical protein [Clostridiales bacterium]